ncbi:hypothetical protein THAOC_07018, partial [Thalassiosira oceanica]
LHHAAAKAVQMPSPLEILEFDQVSYGDRRRLRFLLGHLVSDDLDRQWQRTVSTVRGTSAFTFSQRSKRAAAWAHGHGPLAHGVGRGAAAGMIT